VLTAGICELTLETRDMAAMERFSCGGLGGEVLAPEDDRAWLSCGERTRLGLWTPGEKEPGGEGGDRSVYAEDPMGNVVEVWDHFEDRRAATPTVGGLAG